MWYGYRIPRTHPRTYLVTDELFTSNVSKMRCHYAEETLERLEYVIHNMEYPTINKKKNSDEYKKLKSLITWTPIKNKFGRYICPETREEYL